MGGMRQSAGKEHRLVGKKHRDVHGQRPSKMREPNASLHWPVIVVVDHLAGRETDAHAGAASLLFESGPEALGGFLRVPFIWKRSGNIIWLWVIKAPRGLQGLVLGSIYQGFILSSYV